MTDGRAAVPSDYYLATHSNVQGWGGGVAVVRGLGNALGRAGYKTLLLGVDEASGEPADPRDSGWLNVPTGVPRRWWRVRNWFVVKTLARSLRRLPPPRCALVTVNPIWVVAAKQAWPGTPVVFIFAALLANCLPFTWPAGRPTLWQWLNYLGIRRIEHAALRLADRILTPTRQALQEIGVFEPSAHERAVVRRYGCDVRAVPASIRRAQRQALGLPSDACVALALGVCERNKAFDLAVRELPAVNERLHLVVVGEGPQRAELVALAAQLGLAHRVHVVGPQPDVEPWYAVADCVVSTSCYDTFPYSLLDGMARGRAVVVPQHMPPRVYSGIAEVIAADGGGVRFDRERPGSLAAQLNHLANDPPYRAALGRQAQYIASRQFRWEPVIAALPGAEPAPGEPDTSGAALAGAVAVAGR